MFESYMPYIVGHPIKQPADFYGRARQVSRFFEIVAGTQVQSASVLGLRRAGKTSFLQFVAHPEVIAAYLPDPGRYTMVYMDVSASKTPPDFYRRLYRRLAGQLYYPELSLSQAPLSVPKKVSADDIESLLCDFPDRRVIVMLDEFDQLRAGDFDQDFLVELRALTSVWEYELAWVTASYWDLFSLGTAIGLPPTSPFYNIFYPSPIFMSGLRWKEAEDLVRRPAERAGQPLDDDEAAGIQAIAGSLPFFLQATAAYWYREKRRQRRPDPEEALSELVKEVAPYFGQWWRQANDLTRELLLRIARQQPVEQLPYRTTEINAMLRRLRNYGVIHEREGVRTLNGLLLERWLRDDVWRDSTGRVARGLPAREPQPVGNGRAGASGQPRSRHTAGAGRNDDSPGEEIYDQVLQTLHDVGKQFERLSSTYSQKGEEDLRDHFLLVLEPMFSGSATGETFNKAGKTDILLRADGSNIFIAECKFWKGAKVYLETIDQLLSYLTWRDAKAAVVVFVRNRDFSTVVRTVQTITPQHPNYLAYVAQRDESWLSYHFHLNGDPDRLLDLAVLLFHIPG
jgi:hypothetical protein